MMDPKHALVTAACVLLLATGCGSGSDDGSGVSIPDRPLSGKIAGADWTALSGKAKPAHDRTDVLFATFIPEASPECGVGLSTPYVHVYLPLEPGDLAVSIENPGAFTTTDETAKTTIHITFTGKVSVESVTETSVTGGLALELDDKPGFSVGGTFDVPRCPD